MKARGPAIEMTNSAPLHTLNDLFCRVAASRNPRAVLWQDEFGQWQPLSSDEMYQRVRALGTSFLDWGAEKGEPIAIISENRWEWAVADFAIMAIGGLTLPIYPTLTGEQEAAMLADAGSKIAIVSSRKQFDKLNAVRSMTKLERIVIMDAQAPEGAIAFSDAIASSAGKTSEHDAVFDALMRAIRPEDGATLIYTSGTTGEPKGVVLTHGNFAANQNIAAVDFNITQQDASISFLPLSHVTARALDYVMYRYGATVAYCSNFDRIPVALREVCPTIFVGVPRVFEKIRQEVERQASLSPVKRHILPWAVTVGSKHKDEVYHGKRPSSLLWKLVNKLAYGKVREAFGGRVRIFVSGGAPLGIETAEWFASMGIALWEGYGLTETSPLISINSPRYQKMGAAGRVLDNLEVKIAEDGELLVKGPSVFPGYWHKPEETAKVFDEEGWFHTGDIGHIDSDRFLFITDRKKELLKTSGGKLVAPQPIENSLKANAFIGQAALVGDKHKFVSVLISPNFAALESWAGQQGIKWTSREELIGDKRVQTLYGGLVSKVNEHLANFESMKRFRVVAEEWSQDTGELTPSIKLKRRVINERYAAVIDELYSDEATSRGGSGK